MLRPVIRRSCQYAYARCITPSSSSLFQKQQQQQQLFPSLLLAIRPSTTCTSAGPAEAASTIPPKITTKTTATASEILRRTLIPSAFASQESVKKLLPIIGNGAYLALASGFLMTDMISLRLMLVSGYTGLVAFHALHKKPLQIPLRWSALFVVVNGGAALLLFMDEWIGFLLSEEELALYDEHFKDDGLTKGQFYYLMKMSKKEHIKDGSVLTQEGRVSPNLYFIHKGKAKVFHHSAFAAYIGEGGFVNDVAFQQQQQQPADAHESSSTDDNNEQQDDNNNNSNSDSNRTVGRISPTPPGVGAYGTVITHGDCTVLVWNQSELKQYLENKLDMDRNMKYTLSRHLVKSLLEQRQARRHKGTSASSSTMQQGRQQDNDLQVEFKRINTQRTGKERGFHDHNDENIVDKQRLRQRRRITNIGLILGLDE